MRSHTQPIFTCYPQNNMHFSVIHISTPSSDTYSLLLLPFKDQEAYNLVFQVFFTGRSTVQPHVKSEDDLSLSCCITHADTEHLQIISVYFNLGGLQLQQLIFYFNLKEQRGPHYSI